MEKKTIGQFMAALRRANGMTQKQLAEKLNVSDKSVSRWERDECAPDLTLIPVIAEIFGVTSDDILRGERMNREFAAEREEKKGEKQIKRLLKSTEDRLKMRSIISVGIALLGIIAAMICNFGFLRAYIGFFAGAVFILLSLICELLFGMQAFAAVSDEDICGEAVNESKAILLKIMEAAFSTIVAFLAFMLPLVMIPWDTYMGISAASWFVEGLVLSVITGILSFFVCWFVNSKTADAYNLSGSEKRAAKNEIKKKQVKFAVILIAATAVIQIVFNAAASADVFTEKKIFYTTEEFI